MKKMQNPMTLSDQPSTTSYEMPGYDWNKQTRNDKFLAGRHTVNSIQTFDGNGHPKDSQSDDND